MSVSADWSVLTDRHQQTIATDDFNPIQWVSARSASLQKTVAAFIPVPVGQKCDGTV